MTKRNGLELTTGIVTFIMSTVSLVLFFLSYTTGYYTFGQMQSPIIAALLGTGMAVEIAALIIRGKKPDTFWPKLLTFCVTALLSGASMLLIGDRVEGIGNCIVTDYDSGHGGEEAIYLSIAASILMLIAVIYNIIGSFAQDFAASNTTSKSRSVVQWTGFGVSAVVVLLAVLLPTANLVKDNGADGTNDPSGTSAAQAGGSYKISYNMNDGTADTMLGYQFLCSDFKGLVQADSRFYVDVTLTLDENGNYTLFSDAYVVESGKRCEIGDDSGLGLILTMDAQGTYVTNEDGIVTTSVPTHAVFEMQTDTYSSQMKEAVNMNVDGNSEDGTYDSDDVPAVLDFVPETIWSLEDGTIQSYRDANLGGSFTVSYNMNNDTAGSMPDYQFLCCDFKGLVQADSRFYVDVTLTLDGNGGYTLFSDAYVVESGNRCEIGDDTGLGMVLTMTAEGAYTENSDGTYTTSIPAHAVFEMQMDTYSSQMKEAFGMSVDGSTEDGIYDSGEVPAILDFIPETIWNLADGSITSWAKAAEGETGNESSKGDETSEGATSGEDSTNGLVFASDDGATTFAFRADGTYRFAFESYNVEDLGTYSYDGSTLTITNSNGAEITATGDPLKFHYVSAISEQLTGDFTIPAADLQQ